MSTLVRTYTAVLVRAGAPEVAGAHAEGDLAEFEVVQELVPFGGGEIAVFFPGSHRPAAGDEGAVV